MSAVRCQAVQLALFWLAAGAALMLFVGPVEARTLLKVSPPSMNKAIRLVPFEANLETPPDCQPSYSWQGPICFRVELQVNSSADGHKGSSVWAPLCAKSSEVAAKLYSEDVAMAACRQFWDTKLKKRPVQFAYGRGLKPVAFPECCVIPPNGFQPAKYKYWATVVGGISEDAKAIQAMKLKVGKSPCESGYLAAIYCEVFAE